MIDRSERIRKLALNVARFSGLAPLVKPMLGGIGAILMLHRVNYAPAGPLGINAHLSVTPRFLDALITDMKRMGYDFVGMDEAVKRIREGGGGREFVAITADDAYQDNLTEALPIFEKHEVPFTIYVAPGLINGTVDLWWEVLEDVVAVRDIVYLPTENGTETLDCGSRQAKLDAFFRLHQYFSMEIPEESRRHAVRQLAQSSGVELADGRDGSLMSWEEVRRISAHPLATIGAHTINHYLLKRLPADAARSEMADAATVIAVETGRRPVHMAYPYGYPAAVGPREVELAAQAGFVSAVTTRHGLIRPQHAQHLLALPRISVNGRYQRLGHLRTMLSGFTTPLANSGRRLVTV